ncbi:MAG TPA: polysaccharide biosynthesis protein [Citreicella sp.]|jgi:O-antigen/teichoic acid export membrane protein|uniref:oligosaccharide flippase family protein n=1 Tax=Salipiger marinus TaxID=555512 RepID=UPI000E83E420|nr:oligosaccharide flippase family protein [Salipiger manganoxidans]MCD1617404.1 oligosaccharide flippase family protein [Salipiger manganoxidans]HBM59539.1 polysaccharide biosynthesis protein [Citreicella sp.]HBT00044.1 polysaccharide biosynthesis protein [Citreicella sp.]
MIPALWQRLNGSSLMARALRSSMLTVGGFGAAQVMRLASNLILTRLLFPEAFGLMALVSVFMMGLQQFSDVGVTPAILQSRRGDERDFLNTAWTIQAVRGAGLWLLACALAWPMAWIYDEPQLLHLLPVASLTLLILGFKPTRMDTANRHLLLGRVTLLDLATQGAGILSAVILAWLTGSVWALVASGILSALIEVLINSRFLPGLRNSFRWEPAAAQELIHFGKWIFLATVCGFFFSQADKILMGKYLPLDHFGIYNIGYFLASFPMLLGSMVTRRILIPIYRETPPTRSRANFLRLRRMRFAVTAPLLLLVTSFAVMGDWLVDVMYDDRYLAAGAVAVIVACMQMPQIIVQTYDQAALAAGDSRSFFVLAAARAVLMVGSILVGLETAGFIGALFGYGAAFLLAYPVVVWLARRMGAWDPLHDLVFAGLGAGCAAFAMWINWESIRYLSLLGQ